MSSIVNPIVNPGADDPYAWLAPMYDGLTVPFLRNVRRDVRRIASELGCRDVLDVCCGTGRMATMLHESGFNVAGVDLSPAMLAQARKDSPPGIRYFLGDAARLHFRDASFDCAVISLALHEMNPSTRMRVIAEAARVTRKGGVIIVADYMRPGGMLGNGFRAFLNVVERIAGRSHHDNYLTYMSNGGIEPLAAGLGLKLTVRRRYFMDTVAVMVMEADGHSRSIT